MIDSDLARPSGGPGRVLIVDDDALLRRRVRLYLGQHAIEVVEAASGEKGLLAIRQERFDVVLLDVMMPGMGGMEVVKRIRAHSNLPIVMLSAKDGESDRVLGLEAGADDYVVKPFHARELLARIRGILRRSKTRVESVTLDAGAITIDLASRTARIEGRALDLGGIEFDLLVALVRSRGRVLPRETLLAQAGRNYTTVSERTVDVHVSRLRKKLGDDPRAPLMIKTVHGVGYVLTQ